MLPSLIDDAPRDFVACGGSLDRLRQQYGVTRRRAQEMVLLGLVRQVERQGVAVRLMGRRAA
ncbi:MAG TPA: hypothetical protein VN442_11095 [Bryobacteraceae bacterium]|nr:hypothetical protein [Bryobacteraceae bacterium]